MHRPVQGFHPSLSRFQGSLRSLLSFHLFLALFLMAVVARSHHCFNFNSSFVEHSSDNLITQHLGRTDNQNGQFCSPDFPCKVSCKVYRFITKSHDWIASFPPQENSKPKGGFRAGSTFRKMVANARAAKVLSHYIAVFYCTFLPFFSQKTQGRVFFFTLFSKPYVKLHSPRSNNHNIQRNKAS